MDTTKLRELLKEPCGNSFLRDALAEVERLLAGAQDATVPASRHPAHRQPKGGAR
jgi:hypothetical protein